MKKLFVTVIVLASVIALAGCNPESTNTRDMDAKPVIYLYPEKAMEISVKLEYDGELTCTYLAYENGWRVLAQPDGTLTDMDTGREYF